ncbi:MAG: amino acid transporter-like protein [Gemmatimonadetes bacterium]|nr:amino acid transporter-like protein [Gemmatimonadota bacterium]
MPTRLKHAIFGRPRDVQDPKTYHSIALVALLAWVGLGADGLSSSAYGPDESFRALGEHTYLAVALAGATALTVLVISVAYSQIIRRFPFGGGGYVVASELLGPRFGVVSGCALLVDYVLTISVSIASGADQVFSVLPAAWHPFKLAVTSGVIVLLVVMNLRGVKESVSILAPIFGLFLLSHVVLIGGGLLTHAAAVPRVAHEVSHGFSQGLGTLGALGLFAVFVRAYSMGAGTYTGIEAVSNGLQIMREPKVRTATRTMLLMAVSLAVTAGGILLLYLLFHVRPEPGKTMNAVLLERFTAGWGALGHPFVAFTLAMEAALLFVAAQAGFIDGPRVMGNMAVDSWLPHRFAQLSDRLTAQDGVLLMGGAALATLFYTRGDITTLVTMYSINVFVTFSLSQAGMIRYWIRERGREGRRRGLAIHLPAFGLCAGILGGVLYEKLELGGWVTVAVTGALVALCLAVRRHYDRVRDGFRRLDDVMASLPDADAVDPAPMDPRQPTAVLLVGGYGGLGIHAMLSVQRLFPDHFKSFVFVSIGVIDAAAMKGVDEVDRVRERTEESLRRYVQLAHKLGLKAGWRMEMGTEAVSTAETLCRAIAKEYPRSLFFMGKLIFLKEGWFFRMLHNNTAEQLQRRLQFEGLNTMLLPIRALNAGPAT